MNDKNNSEEDLYMGLTALVVIAFIVCFLVFSVETYCKNRNSLPLVNPFTEINK